MLLPKQICMLPWVSLETSPTGGARPCCMFKEEIKDEHGDRYLLTKTPLSDIYNSKYMQTLRAQFRNGDLPEQCSSCWDEEKAGRQSKRMSTFLRLPHLANEVEWENDTPNQLKFIDLKLGNICNLKCRICGSWSSSKWAKEELAYTPHVDKKDHLATTFFKQGQWPRKAPKFWEDLKSLLPQISYFEFTGGEPFLIQQHFDLLQFAVDSGEAHHIEIHYNTNATQWPDHAADIWRHFKTVEVAFSIDNLGKRFEYERYGAKWKTAEQIVTFANGLRKEMPNLQTQMCLTVNIFNVYYLEELCAWMSRQQFNYDYFNMLHGEKEYRIDQMTLAAKELVISKLRNGSFTTEHKKQIEFIINFINNGPCSDGKRFVEKVKKTDDYRKQCLLDTHKEIAEAMGYTK
jgi:MoaA/NifB/PqqE/SkfB family radical SAM enzyme